MTERDRFLRAMSPESFCTPPHGVPIVDIEPDEWLLTRTGAAVAQLVDQRAAVRALLVELDHWRSMTPEEVDEVLGRARAVVGP